MTNTQSDVLPEQRNVAEHNREDEAAGAEMYPANPGIVGSANQWIWRGHRGWPAGLHGEGSTESGQGKWRKQVVAMFVSLQGNAQQDHRQEGRCRDGEGTAAVHHPVVRQGNTDGMLGANPDFIVHHCVTSSFCVTSEHYLMGVPKTTKNSHIHILCTTHSCKSRCKSSTTIS